jgi:uncharacterized protein (TIGR01732 family)
MNNTNCEVQCEEKRPSCGSGLVLVVVLYILLAIILSSFRAC